MRHARLLTVLTAASTAVAVPMLADPALAAGGPTVVRVSTDSHGGQLNSMNDGQDITPNGRYVLFDTLVSIPATPSVKIKSNLFLKDRVTGKTRQVDVGLGGADPNGNVSEGKVSDNGRYVVFGSAASNLVADDTNGKSDVFRRDMRTGKITRVSTGYSGAAGSGSAAGIYLDISGNGNLVVFDSTATDLVPGDTNGTQDVFVRNMRKGSTQRVSVSSSGEQSEPMPANPPTVYLKNRDNEQPVISGDGRWVAFASKASNLVPGDTNQASDIFVHSLVTGKTTRVSVRADGSQAETGDKYGTGASYPSISANGKVVAFESVYTDLLSTPSRPGSNAYVHHLKTGKNELAKVNADGSPGTAGATAVILSPSGKSVAFYTPDKTLVPGDPGQGAFLRNLVTGKVRRVGTNPDASPSELSSAITAVANDRTVLFQSAASDIVPNDTNDDWDAFVATF